MAFDQALGQIVSALGEHSSKASYLHGSFGSDKSHFIAMLHALLDGDVDTRSCPDLVARHQWLTDAKLLLVPYHLIGADSLEAAIHGGYVMHVRELHPTRRRPRSTAPGVIDDARAIRDRLGTEAFLAALPSAESDGAWGVSRTGHRRRSATQSGAHVKPIFDATGWQLLGSGSRAWCRSWCELWCKGVTTVSQATDSEA